MARASIEDPLKNFRYRIEIDGFQRAGFSEATGFSRKTEVAKYREGGMNETVQKSAGLNDFDPVNLSRGLIIGSSRGGSDDFVNWANQVHQIAVLGNAANYRRDIDVDLYGPLNTKTRTNRLYECWPSKFDLMGDLKADGSDNLIEKLELQHEGWEIITLV